MLQKPPTAHRDSTKQIGFSGLLLGADSARSRRQARMDACSRSTMSERCSRGCRAAARCWCAIVCSSVSVRSYVAFSQDETEIGFAFPKEERAALVAARPDVFFLPRESELRFHWIEAWLDALDPDEMRELVLDAWRMVVPQRVAREVLVDGT